MKAYEVVLVGECADPWLTCVRSAIVLTMRDRGRDIQLSSLSKLCARTYVQYNAGHERAHKPAWVRNSCTDIIHAYMHACDVAKDMGYVLILEDDARLARRASRADFARVDDGIRVLRPLVYTLGSFGATIPTPLSLDHAQILRGIFGCAHAIVWSPEARTRLLRHRRRGPTFEHIDAGFLAFLGSTYTYRTPLVVQRLLPTVNSDQWCLLCDHSRLDRGLVASWKRLLVMLSLDTSDDGWYLLYRMQNVVTSTIVASVLVFVLTSHKHSSESHLDPFLGGPTRGVSVSTPS